MGPTDAVNVYELAARRYWERYLPEHVAELEDPDAYFRGRGEHLLDAVAQAMLSTGPRSKEGETSEELMERMAPLLLAARVAVLATELPSAPRRVGNPELTNEEQFDAWVDDVSRFIVLLDDQAAEGEGPAPAAVDAIRPRVAKLMQRALDPGA
jgi:hypothetical protein